MTEVDLVFEHHDGVPSRYADPVTRDLNRLSRTFEDVQQLRKTHAMRLANDLYGSGEKTPDQMVDLLEHREISRFFELEKVYTRELEKVLRQHVLWDWLSPLTGLAGARTGRIIATIGDPWRFPGQRCTQGHTFPPQFAPGSPCPLTEGHPEIDRGVEKGAAPHDAEHSGESDAVDGVVRCRGVLLDPRQGTGVRSVWHYFGLAPGADGRLMRRRKGTQVSYSPQGRALLLGEQGTADQIIRHRTPRYRDIYDDFKAARQTTADAVSESDDGTGAMPAWQLNKIARTVAAKAFLGDLLTEWKRRTPDVQFEIDGTDGRAA